MHNPSHTTTPTGSRPFPTAIPSDVVKSSHSSCQCDTPRVMCLRSTDWMCRVMETANKEGNNAHVVVSSKLNPHTELMGRFLLARLLALLYAAAPCSAVANLYFQVIEPFLLNKQNCVVCLRHRGFPCLVSPLGNPPLYTHATRPLKFINCSFLSNLISL